MTARLRRHAGKAVGTGRAVSGVSGELPISWPTVHAAFVAHAEDELREPEPPRVLGIDETRRGRPVWRRRSDGRWERLDRFETNFVDLTGAGGLLGQASGRAKSAVIDWLDARGPAWKATVEVVAIDPCATYRRATYRDRPGS